MRRWWKLAVLVLMLGAFGPGGCEAAFADGAYEEQEATEMASPPVTIDKSQTYRVPQTLLDAVRVLDLYQAGRLRRTANSIVYEFGLPVGAAQSTRIVPSKRTLRYVHVAMFHTDPTVEADVLLSANVLPGGAIVPAGGVMNATRAHLSAAGVNWAGFGVLPAPSTSWTMEAILLPGESLYALRMGAGGPAGVNVLVTVVDIETGEQK